MAAAAGEYDGVLPEPRTRFEKIMRSVINRLKSAESPETVGQAMTEFVGNNPEFWNNIPDGTITRAQLADDVPEQIRDETLLEISAAEVNKIFDSAFHNN